MPVSANVWVCISVTSRENVPCRAFLVDTRGVRYDDNYPGHDTMSPRYVFLELSFYRDTFSASNTVSVRSMLCSAITEFILLQYHGFVHKK